MTVQHSAFIDLELALAKKVSKAYRRETNKLVDKIQPLIKAGDFAQAASVVNAFDPTPVVEKVRPMLNTVARAALFLGVSRLSPPKDSETIKNPPLESLQKLSSQFEHSLMVTVADAVRAMCHKRLAEIENGATWLTQDISKAQPAELEASGLGNLGIAIPSDRKYYGYTFNPMKAEIPQVTDPYISVNSSLVVSRSNTFGFIEEALHKNIEVYKVNEVLDDRTCVVCQEMNGKVFRIEQAAERALAIMEADNPDDLKTLAPWPNQTKEGIASLKTMSTDDLVTAGYTMPPFHPRCRGFLDEWTETQLDAPYVSAEDWARRYDDPEITVDKVLAGFNDPDLKAKMLVESRRLSGMTPTDALFKKNGVWDAARVKTVHDPIIKKFLTKDVIERTTAKAGTRPEYITLGGRPASGKSFFARPKAQGGRGLNDDGRFFVFHSDAVLDDLPGYAGWNAALYHEEAKAIADKVIAIARAKKMNLIVEGTMKNADKVIRNAEMFKKAGYDVSGFYMHLPRQVSAQRTVKRFIDEGRYVPIDVVLANQRNEATFDLMTKTYKRWEIYDNQGNGLPKLLAASKNSLDDAVAAVAPKPLAPISFKSLESATKYGVDNWKDTIKAMTPAQAKSLDDYKGHYYRAVNPQLRQRASTLPPTVASQDDIKRVISDMDDVIAMQGVPDDIVVWRGQSLNGIEDLVPGAEFVDNGFVSTSMSSRVAGRFVDSDHHILARIVVPKGTNAIFLERHKGLRLGYFDDPEVNPVMFDGGEAELVFGRSTRFKVVEYNPSVGMLQLELVPDSLPKPPVPPPIVTKQDEAVTENLVEKYVWELADLALTN